MSRPGPLLLGLSCVWALAGASCAYYPRRADAEVDLTRSGQRASSYESALLTSGAADLQCDDVTHSVVPIRASCTSSRFRTSCSASVDVVDGCGRRAVYGKRCNHIGEHVEKANGTSGEDVTIDTSACWPSLLSRADLGDDGLDETPKRPKPATVPLGAPAPRSPRLEAPPEAPALEQANARASLDAVDVDGCRDSGVRPGYGHAKVTFAPDGHVALVAIDAPADLPPKAVECVAERFAAVSLPPFGGKAVTIGTTWLSR